MRDEWVRLLGEAIVEQAASDYACLRGCGEETAEERGLEYGIREIQDFFLGKWCERILKAIYIGYRVVEKDGTARPVNGKDFLTAM